jgi:hypothetical protein
VTLGQHLSLSPLTDAYFDAITRPGAPMFGGFRNTRGNHFAKFDADGLGRHRETEDWLLPTRA